VQTYARLAGLLYLLQAALSIGSVVAARGMLEANAASAAKYVAVSLTLTRVGISGLAFTGVTIIALAGALHALLRSTAPNLSLIAFAFRTAECTIYAIAAITSFIALSIVEPGGADTPGQQALWAFLHQALLTELSVSTIFFWFGSSLFFYLLFKSKFIPSLLALFGLLATLISGGVTFVSLILPATGLRAELSGGPLLIAELLTGAWLLALGAKVAQASAAAPRL
jgi:hypothetical protein